MNATPMHDKVVVIVGGTGGLGLSASMALLEAGAKVVAIGKPDDTTESARAALGSSARVIGGDALKPEVPRDAIALALAEFGRFDALYHVAGGSGRKFGDGPVHEISDEGWDHTIALNLSSVFNSNRAAVKAFLQTRTQGAVLNMSSVLAYRPTPQLFATHAYAAAKAAVIGLTRSLASYYAPYGIRANVIAPALTDTPMAQRAIADPATMRYIRTKQPLGGGRPGVPQDCDGAAVYLLSDAARFVTGQVLAIDGGWSVSDGQIESDGDDPRLLHRH
jgi:NAD(P)-dependent dehydrogenase (short-subunit alcohol dehydrogenase family)